MRTPRISVVIPCKDRQALLERALASVAAQTRLPGEVVVVDDGSERALVLPGGYPFPVRCIRQENGGPAAARNHGIREATGDWIALLDSDDLWFPEKLEFQTELIGAYPMAGFCACDTEYRGMPASPFPLHPPSGMEGSIIPDAFARIVADCYIHTSGVMFSRDAFLTVGGFDESIRFCEDWDLWIRLAGTVPTVATSKRLTAYCREGTNLSEMPRAGYPLVGQEALTYVLQKAATNPLFEANARELALSHLRDAIYGLAYHYRKHGLPHYSWRASWWSLRNGGGVLRNLKNFAYSLPDYIRASVRESTWLQPAPWMSALHDKVLAGLHTPRMAGPTSNRIALSPSERCHCDAS